MNSKTITMISTKLLSEHSADINSLSCSKIGLLLLAECDILLYMNTLFLLVTEIDFINQ